MDKTTLTKKIKEQAQKLGFPLVGVTTPDPPPHLEFFLNWLQSGFQASMDWIGNDRSLDRRADPRVILPECRSILVLGSPYPSPRGNVGGGNIASYALNQDYHDVLGTRLQALVDAIDGWVGKPVPNRWYTDTGPVLEKELAMRAGLGWIGKNTMLLDRKLGSELFLGALLTDLELEPDAPTTGHCGTCTACLDACPTDAFPEPYVLDARRCVGYLTVEHRGEIPTDLVPAMADMVAGCDRCNEVCPWTKKAPADLHPEFAPAEHRYRPRLADLEALDEDGWKAWRQASPLGRIPFSQLRRSLAVARKNLDQRKN